MEQKCKKLSYLVLTSKKSKKSKNPSSAVMLTRDFLRYVDVGI